MIDQDESGLDLKQKLILVCLLVIAACSAILVYNVLDDALSKDGGWVVGGFIALLLVIWFLVEWGMSAPTDGARDWRSWLVPGRVYRFAAVAIAPPLAISAALPLFDPGPITEEGVSKAVAETLDRREKVAHEKLLAAIPGLWGEDGCAVAYRFSVAESKAIVIDWERRPPGRPAWRATGAIVAVRGNRIETRGEMPASERGKAAAFEYVSNGAIEKLGWKDESRGLTMELVRCA